MSSEENKALREKFTALIAARNLDEALALFGPGFVSHASGRGDGVEGVRAYFTMVFEAFPDFRTTSLHMISEGDMLVDHVRVEATHTGMFMGLPPSGKQLVWSFIDILRISDGQIVEHWNLSDQFGVMQQLGLIPAPPQA